MPPPKHKSVSRNRQINIRPTQKYMSGTVACTQTGQATSKTQTCPGTGHATLETKLCPGTGK